VNSIDSTKRQPDFQQYESQSQVYACIVVTRYKCAYGKFDEYADLNIRTSWAELSKDGPTIKTKDLGWQEVLVRSILTVIPGAEGTVSSLCAEYLYLSSISVSMLMYQSSTGRQEPRL
jgi:hypothetical protein